MTFCYYPRPYSDSSHLNSKYCNYQIRCNECNINKIRGYCNICNKKICCNKKCCELFPHYYNTVLIICNCCVNKIEKKLYILEENNSIILSKRELKKIKNKICKINYNV